MTYFCNWSLFYVVTLALHISSQSCMNSNKNVLQSHVVSTSIICGLVFVCIPTSKPYWLNAIKFSATCQNNTSVYRASWTYIHIVGKSVLVALVDLIFYHVICLQLLCFIITICTCALIRTGTKDVISRQYKSHPGPTASQTLVEVGWDEVEHINTHTDTK